MSLKISVLGANVLIPLSNFNETVEIPLTLTISKEDDPKDTQKAARKVKVAAKLQAHGFEKKANDVISISSGNQSDSSYSEDDKPGDLKDSTKNVITFQDDNRDSSFEEDKEYSQNYY